jgi:transcriptional repressor NrdR
MLCKKCEIETRVVDSRREGSSSVTRRRECPTCKERFSTVETIKQTVVRHSVKSPSKVVKPISRSPKARHLKPVNPFDSREDYGSRAYESDLRDIGFDLSNDY